MLDESNRRKRFERLSQRIREQFIQTVPEEIALCEFDCRKASCSAEQWRTCERRMRKAKGELTPAA